MRKVSKCMLAFAVLLLLGEAVCSANLIAYTTSSRNRERLMVMEDSGADPTELVLGGKFSPPPAFPSVSPAGGADDTWILFSEYYDLYKIRPDGSEETLVLCGGGTDFYGDPYSLEIYGADWSPDGSEILVYTYPVDPTAGYPWFLGLIPATHTAEPSESCPSALVRIYPEPDSPWSPDGKAAWGHDGSRLAFLEFNALTYESRMSVIERQATGTWEFVYAFEPIAGSADLPDGGCYSPFDWQPGTSLLICSQRVPPPRNNLPATFWLASIDLDNHVLDFVLDKGSRIEMDFNSSPTWSADGSQILFTDPGGNLVKWTYPDGDREVIGSGDRAHWQRDVLLSTCDLDTDCNDFNECTSDRCDAAGSCEHVLLTGDPCGVGGWCEDGACFEPECSVDADCDDFNECTTEECSSGYECLYDFVAADEPCDDDGDFCTVDACDGAGTCESVFNPEIPGCEPVGGLPGDPCTTGADCLSGLCHPKRLVCK